MPVRTGSPSLFHAVMYWLLAPFAAWWVALSRYHQPSLVAGAPVSMLICQFIELTMPFSVIRPIAEGGKRIADADEPGNRVQPVMLGESVPAGKAIGGKAEFEALVGILHMAGKIFTRAGAHSIDGRDGWKVRSRQLLIVEMAVPPVHKDEGAREANAIRAADFGLYESSILATPQHRRGNFHITGQRPDKGNLCRLQWRQVTVCERRRLIRQRRAKSAIGCPPLMPAWRDRYLVRCSARFELGEDGGKVHGSGLTTDICPRKAREIALAFARRAC